MLRALLIGLSENRLARALAERSQLGVRMSRRFVAGTTPAEVLAATEAMNRMGMTVSIDNRRENVTNTVEARRSACMYEGLLTEIEARKLQRNVSLKLTDMGLDIEPQL